MPAERVSGPFLDGLGPTRHATAWRRCGRITGGTCQGAFEAGEEVDDVGRFEHSIALASHVALAQDAGVFEAIHRFAGAHLGPPDQACRTFDCEHRHTRQDIEQQFDRRVGADPPELFAPSCVECFDPFGVRPGVVARTMRSCRKRSKPRAGAGGALRTVRRTDVSECGEAGDVVTCPGGEHEADWWDESRCEAASTKDDVDERAAGPAVAVGEGVDRLELSMGDRCLHERGMVVAVDVFEEILQQRLEGLRWRRDERSRTRVVAAATDPVLRRADDTADVRPALCIRAEGSSSDPDPKPTRCAMRTTGRGWSGPVR